MAYRFINFLCFQVAWFACVLGAAHGLPALGPAVVAVWVTVHLSLSRSRRAELRVLLGAGLVGFLADSVLALSGRIDFETGVAAWWPVPLWMVALWVNLATTLGASLSFLRDRFLLAVLLGAIGGPLAYLAGDRLGALRLGDPQVASIVAVGVEWAAAMPLLLGLDRLARAGRGCVREAVPSNAVFPLDHEERP